jgi:hypothetical protein
MAGFASTASRASYICARAASASGCRPCTNCGTRRHGYRAWPTRQRVGPAASGPFDANDAIGRLHGGPRATARAGVAPLRSGEAPAPGRRREGGAAGRRPARRCRERRTACTRPSMLTTSIEPEESCPRRRPRCPSRPRATSSPRDRARRREGVRARLLERGGEHRRPACLGERGVREDQRRRVERVPALDPPRRALRRVRQRRVEQRRCCPRSSSPRPRRRASPPSDNRM